MANISSQSFTTNGTWVCPAGVTRVQLVADPFPSQYRQLGKWVIDGTGNIWVWGIASAGQLGNGVAVTAFSNSSSPNVVIGAGIYKYVSMGKALPSLGTMGALDQNGNIWTWGSNGSGNLGINIAPPAPASVSSPVMVVGGYKFCRYYSDGTVGMGLDVQGNIRIWGSNQVGYLGAGLATTIAAVSSPVLVLSGQSFVDMGSCAGNGTAWGLTTAGQVWTWGFNQQGALGANLAPQTVVAVSSPVLVVGGITFAKMVQTQSDNNGQTLFCGIDTQGRAWTWGSNDFGGLGANLSPITTVAVSSPVLVVGGITFTDIQSYYNNSNIMPTFVGLDTSGNLWTWGCNLNGMLGANLSSATVESVSSPVLVVGGNKYMYIGQGSLIQENASTIVALDTQGRAWTWGSNTGGQLGANLSPATIAAVSSPVLVVGGNAPYVSCGLITDFGNPLAIDANGQMWTWGANTDGALGNNTASNNFAASTPVMVVGSVCVGVTPEVVKTVSVTPGVSYALTVQAAQTLFGPVSSAAIIVAPGRNKLTVVYEQ